MHHAPAATRAADGRGPRNVPGAAELGYREGKDESPPDRPADTSARATVGEAGSPGTNGRDCVPCADGTFGSSMTQASFAILRSHPAANAPAGPAPPPRPDRDKSSSRGRTEWIIPLCHYCRTSDQRGPGLPGAGSGASLSLVPGVNRYSQNPRHETQGSATQLLSPILLESSSPLRAAS